MSPYAIGAAARSCSDRGAPHSAPAARGEPARQLEKPPYATDSRRGAPPGRASARETAACDRFSSWHLAWRPVARENAACGRSRRDASAPTRLAGVKTTWSASFHGRPRGRPPGEKRGAPQVSLRRRKRVTAWRKEYPQCASSSPSAHTCEPCAALSNLRPSGAGVPRGGVPQRHTTPTHCRASPLARPRFPPPSMTPAVSMPRPALRMA